MILNLKNPALALYFVSFVLYLFFFKIYDDKEFALLFKPMIVTSISFYYFFKKRTKSSKFLLITFLSLFGSDAFFVMYKYYTYNELWLYLGCLVEIPCYFFLVKYFIFRDQENSVVAIR